MQLSGYADMDVLGCEHKSVEHCPICRNCYVCNRFFFFSAVTGPIYADFW